MSTCTSCGEELPPDAQYCGNCGMQVVGAEPNNFERDGFSVKMAFTAAIMGLIIGFFAAWATINLDISAWTFLIGFLGGSYYLYQKPIPSSAIGSGLYITALVMAVTPLFFYIPGVVGASSETAAGAGTFIGGLIGLALWGFVFLIFALVTFVIGYFVNRRAKKKLGSSV